MRANGYNCRYRSAPAVQATAAYAALAKTAGISPTEVTNTNTAVRSTLLSSYKSVAALYKNNTDAACNKH
jgi:hypothetical protein